eukprot:g3010.t1
MEDAPRGDITSDVDRATKEIAIAHFQLTKELHDAIIKTPSDAILTARLQTYVSSEGKINGGSITSGGSRKISVRDVYFELKKHLGIDVTLAEFPDLLTALSLHVSEQDDCEGNGNVFWMRSKKEDNVASIDNELELEYLELFYTRGCVVFEELLLALDFLRQNETGPLALGSRVVKWRIMGKEPAYGANVCFLGPTHFALGIWAGLRLDTPHGKNDGTVNNMEYFRCKDKHGLFIRPKYLTLTSLPSKGGEMMTGNLESIRTRRNSILFTDERDEEFDLDNMKEFERSSKDELKEEEEEPEVDEKIVIKRVTDVGSFADSRLCAEHDDDEFDLSAAIPLTDTTDLGVVAPQDIEKDPRDPTDLVNENAAGAGAVSTTTSMLTSSMRRSESVANDKIEDNDDGQKKKEEEKDDGDDEEEEEGLIRSTPFTSSSDEDDTPEANNSPSTRTKRAAEVGKDSFDVIDLERSIDDSGPADTSVVFEPELENEQLRLLASPPNNMRKKPRDSGSSLSEVTDSESPHFEALKVESGLVASMSPPPPSPPLSSRLQREEACNSVESVVARGTAHPLRSAIGIRKTGIFGAIAPTTFDATSGSDVEIGEIELLRSSGVEDILPQSVIRNIHDLSDLLVSNSGAHEESLSRSIRVVNALVRLVAEKTRMIEKMSRGLRHAERDAIRADERYRRSEDTAVEANRTLGNAIRTLEPQLTEAAEAMKRKDEEIRRLVQVKDDLTRRAIAMREQIATLRTDIVVRGTNSSALVVDRMKTREGHVLALQRQNDTLKRRLAEMEVSWTRSAESRSRTLGDEESSNRETSRLRDIVLKQSKALDELVFENEASAAENERLVRVIESQRRRFEVVEASRSHEAPDVEMALKDDIERQANVISELTNFRSLALEKIKEQATIIETNVESEGKRNRLLGALHKDVRNLRSQLRATRRPALQLRAAISKITSDIGNAITSAFRVQSARVRSQANLVRAFESSMSDQKLFVKTLMRRKGSVRRVCWVSNVDGGEDDDGVVDDKRRQKQIRIVPSTSENGVTAISARFGSQSFVFDNVFGPSAHVKTNVLGDVDNVVRSVLNGVGACVFLLWPSLSQTSDDVDSDYNSVGIYALGRIFDLREAHGALRCSLKVVAVHNEAVFDLLRTSSRLSREKESGRSQLPATEVKILSAADLKLVFSMACDRRDELAQSCNWSLQHVHVVATLECESRSALSGATERANLHVVHVASGTSNDHRDAPFASVESAATAREAMFLRRSHVALRSALHKRSEDEGVASSRLVDLVDDVFACGGAVFVAARVSTQLSSSMDVLHALQLSSLSMPQRNRFVVETDTKAPRSHVATADEGDSEEDMLSQDGHYRG